MTLNELLQQFDQLVETGSDDELFASSYIRGFLLLHADLCKQGCLSAQFIQSVDDSLRANKRELTPQDQVIVNQYWQQIAANL